MDKIKNWEEYRPRAFEYKGQWIYNWFSNMIPFTTPIIVQNIAYYSVENYYQAMKFKDARKRLYIARLEPHRAKREARKLVLREDWDDTMAIKVMKKALLHKWSQEPFRTQLLKAKLPIIEWNNWNDKKWGVSVKDNEGQNLLGNLLTDIKNNLKS